MYKKWLLIPVLPTSFVLLLTLGLFLGVFSQDMASGESSSVAGSEVLESLNAAFIEVAKIARPSVVNISATTTLKRSSRRRSRTPRSPRDFWDFFERPPQEEQRKRDARGSGFIVREDGYILTNSHVIEGADKIKVILADEREFEAKLIGTDKETEVAVIKIEAEDLPTAVLGDSDKLQVGELVMAIGNPFALSHTVTNGIVSAIGRSGVLEAVTYQDFIQTDAAINPGNSGGPLVNIRGEVIGINTAIALATTVSGMPIRGNVGIGFAIPINMARDVMNQLIETGEVVRGYLGVQFQPGQISKDMAEKYGLDEPTGSLIAEVPDGPSKDAGLKQGDLILEFNGEAVKNNEHLQKLVAAARPGDIAKVKVIRNRKKKDFEVTLGERSKDLALRRQGVVPEEQEEWRGIGVQELTGESAKQYEGKQGVLISSIDPESPVAQVDNPPQVGDLINEIDFEKIENMDDYKQAIEKIKDDEGAMIRLTRAGRVPWYVLAKE